MHRRILLSSLLVLTVAIPVVALFSLSYFHYRQDSRLLTGLSDGVAAKGEAGMASPAITTRFEGDPKRALQDLRVWDAVVLGIAAGLGLLVAWGLRELWRRETRFRLTIETTQDWFWVCDEGGVFLYSNPAVGRILSYPRDDMIGKALADFLEGEDAQRFRTQILPDAVARKTGWSKLVLKWTHQHGGLCYLESNAVPILDARGRLTGFRGTDRDITDRQLMEQQLEMSRDAALRSARAKSDFLAVMSHEIRTPLNGVIGMASILAGTQLTPLQQDCLETIKISGDSLLAIIDDILNFSKIESGRLRLELKPFSLEQCVGEALDYFVKPLGEKRLSVISSIHSEVPSTVIGDLNRLRQVLSNLLSNAVKFTAEGTVKLTIRQLQAETDGRHLEFSVQDTGIGIPAEAIPLLFQSFQQVDRSTTRTYGGTGLGLAISKKLVEMMGGTMWVDSEPGQGSTFFFTAVFQEAPSCAPGASTMELPSARQKADLGASNSVSPLKILLAEDNAINRKVLVILLRQMGFEADVAENGDEVVSAAERERYDLILMDIQMPRLDGIEAARRIREKMVGQTPYMVAVTANALEGDREKFLAKGFDAYLSKPVEAATLRSTMDRFQSARNRQHGMALR